MSSLAVSSNNVAGYASTSQSFSMTPIVSYRINFKYRARSGTPSVQMTATGFATTQNRFIVTRDDIWQEISIIATAGSSTGNIRFVGSDNLSGANRIYIDDVIINVAQ